MNINNNAQQPDIVPVAQPTYANELSSKSKVIIPATALKPRLADTKLDRLRKS